MSQDTSSYLLVARIRKTFNRDVASYDSTTSCSQEDLLLVSSIHTNASFLLSELVNAAIISSREPCAVVFPRARGFSLPLTHLPLVVAVSSNCTKRVDLDLLVGLRCRGCCVPRYCKLESVNSSSDTLNKLFRKCLCQFVDGCRCLLNWQRDFLKA